MKKQNLTEYTNKELSLRVLNDECLYNLINTPDFISVINELFIYTDDQLEDLQNALNDNL